ncbi:vWA domain-containing protein [Paraglaciecola hydrolytica]|uniref:vWA domain-containing protein n=1 Tax=Paraglaciecola hydrolytica TaxID=1799789 RepID=UPI000838A8E4|nr:VWA domain-containing protein [Paraglaciecola hydrolytica]
MQNQKLAQSTSAPAQSIYGFRRSLIALTVFSLLGTACSSDIKREAQTEQEQDIIVLSRPTAPVELELIRAEKHKMLQADAMQSAQTRMKVMASGMQMQNFAMPAPPQQNTENYQHLTENGVKAVCNEPVSTFSIDVDTGSYTNVRRMLNQGVLPPADAVRVEEFINYFDYHYPLPKLDTQPFSINTDVAVSPWNKDKHLVRIALKGYTPEIDQTLGSNLVFLLDVSGSMDQANKLPLLIRSLNMLTQQLSSKDTVSIVVYAGASGVVLEPTKGNNRAKIEQALMQLKAGGSTNGQAGIELAYNMAEQAFIKGGVNRVLLATDGDFNVGQTDHKQLIELIKRKKEKGIALTTLGFGQGNYNDHLMEQLADAGNGNYVYIDTIHEARKVLVDELSSTLLTIAKDVKIQVEFNPATVAEYRLVGYENRKLNQEDFNNDKVDAGEIGAGHTVTAFYEISLTDSNNLYLDPLRYGAQAATRNMDDKHNLANELALVKLRYKPIDSETSLLVTQTIQKQQITDFNSQSDDFRFASAVLGFAHKLKQSHYLQDMDYAQLVNIAQQAKGSDDFGYRAEFIQLVKSADSLQVNNQTEVLQKPELIANSVVQPLILQGKIKLLGLNASH